MADKKVAEQYYTPPPKLGRWEGFRLFLWNSETSQFLGRTGASWVKIIFFYIVFYAALCGFFAAMLAVFYQTLDDRMPKWQLDNGLIGTNPGLGFRPMPPEKNVESTLVWYKKSNPDNMLHWTEELKAFLKPYTEKETNENRIDCTFQKPANNQVCDVNMANFAPCTEKTGFNYDKGGPCIFLKLNKIYNWKPDIYTNGTDLPHNMPEDLKRLISDKNKPDKDVVWVTCSGENPADVENIGAIQYFPKRGFPAYYFPYKNIDGYLPPIVAVLFEAPKTGVLINIECKAWARNIQHDRAERRGSVHFELMIDE